MKQSGLILTLLMLSGCSTGGFDLSFSPSLPSAPSYGYSDPYGSYDSSYGYGSSYSSVYGPGSAVGYAEPSDGRAYGSGYGNPGYTYGMSPPSPPGQSSPQAPVLTTANEAAFSPTTTANISEMHMLLTELRQLIQAPKAPAACDCEPVALKPQTPRFNPVPVATHPAQQAPAYLPLDELFALRGYRLPAQALSEPEQNRPPARPRDEKAERSLILPWLQQKPAYAREFKGQVPHFFKEQDAQGHARIWIQIDMLKVDQQWRPETQLQEIVDELYLALQEIQPSEASG